MSIKIMSIIRSTNYAPDIFKALNGLLLVYKPPKLSNKALINELRERITDQLHQYKPRPIDSKMIIEGSINSEKRIIEKPNLADHPLVVGPRYLPWDLSVSSAKPHLEFRSSGLDVIMIGPANKYFRHKLRSHKLASIYHITGHFGHVTDTFFYDGKVTDKATYDHITPGKIDAALARIEASQHDRIFDAASVPLNSQEAYELAKEWPSRPPKMARWPVIYRIRCIHFKLPIFKLEVMVLNETESMLAQIPHDVAQMLKSAAFTNSIRRVKYGPFDVNDSLTDKDWNLESIIKQFFAYHEDHQKFNDMIDAHGKSLAIRGQHKIPTRRKLSLSYS